MPKKPSVPTYRRHATGQAFVRSARINGGRNVYLGKFDSPESKRRYAQLIEQLSAAGNSLPVDLEAGGTLVIVELIELFEKAAKEFYTHNGRVKREFKNVQLALRSFDKFCGEKLPNEFEASDLEAYQKYLIGRDLCRRIVNRRTSIVKRFWAWCCKNHKATGVRKTMYHELLAVKGVQAGTMNVREAPEVRPVPLAIVEKTLPWLSPVLATMIRVQLICGMRPDEVCRLRMCDVDTRRKCWIFKPTEHKNAWRRQTRMIAIPRIAQDLLKPFLARDPTAYLFSPAESEQLRREAIRAAAGKKRKTKVFPCEVRARERNKAARLKRIRKRPHRTHYDTASYRRAIAYGIAKAGKAGVSIPHWHPHRLRHTISTRISQALGSNHASKRWLGHTNMATTDIYTARQRRELLKIAKRLERHWEGTILARTPGIMNPELKPLTNPAASASDTDVSTTSPVGSSTTSQSSGSVESTS